MIRKTWISKEKCTKCHTYGVGERPQHRFERNKRQAGSGGDGTLVIANRSIWRDRIAINIICYQLKIQWNVMGNEWENLKYEIL